MAAAIERELLKSNLLQYARGCIVFDEQNNT
jgi:hypothetical protein